MISRILPYAVQAIAWLWEVAMRIFGKAVVRQVIIDELRRYAKKTDNKLDDALVHLLEARLMGRDLSPETVVVNGLEELAKKTSNKVNDKLISEVRLALKR